MVSSFQIRHAIKAIYAKKNRIVSSNYAGAIMDFSVICILISLIIIVILALKDIGIMLIASLTVAIFSNMGVLDTLMDSYIKSFVNYAGKFFLIFLFASVFGKYLDYNGEARPITVKIFGLIEKDNQFYVLLFISAIACLLTFGGVSLFVVIFAIMTIAFPLFRELNIPWRLFIAPFYSGIGSFSMSMIPRAPSVFNIMPTKYLGAAGQLEAPDFGGPDIWRIVGDNLLKVMNNSQEANVLPQEKIQTGKLGLKSGEGFFEYEGARAKEARDGFLKRLTIQLKASENYL